MSFLYYDNTEPITKASFKALKAKELAVWDESQQQYVPVVGGSGGGGDLPGYLKANSIEVSGVANIKTVLDENSVDVSDLAANTGTSLTPTSLTFGDSGGNVAFTKSAANMANKLAAGIAAAQNTVIGDGRTLLVWDYYTNSIIRTNNMKLVKNSSEYSTLEPSALAVVNNTLGSSCTISPSKFVSTDASKNLLILGSSNVIYGQATAPSGNILDTNATYTSLTKQGLNIKEASLPTVVLARDDIVVSNNLKTIASAPAIATSRMVTFDTVAKSFNYAPIPSADAVTLPKTYYKSVNVNDFPAVNAALNAFVAGQERAVKTYALNSGDRLVFDFGATPYIKYNVWYVVGLALPSMGYKSLIKASHIPYRLSDVGVDVQTCYVQGTAFTGGAYTVQPYHIAFKLTKTGIANSTTDYSGYVEFYKVLHDSSVADTITPT